MSDRANVQHIINRLVNAHGYSPTINSAAARALAELWDELERVKKERDAAIEDIPRACGYCKHFIVTHNGCTPDYDCAQNGCMNVSGINTGWEWRGVQEDG